MNTQLFQDMTLCCAVSGHAARTSPHDPQYECTMFLRNVRNGLSTDPASYSTRPRTSATLVRHNKTPLALKCIKHNSVQHMQTTNLSVLQQNVLILFITVYIYPDCGARTSRATEPDDDTGPIRKQQPDALQQKDVTALLPWSTKTGEKQRCSPHLMAGIISKFIYWE